MDNTTLKSFLYAKENISFGMEEYKHGNYQNALRAFDSVIRSDCRGVFYLAFYCRGLTYMKLGHLEYAVNDFTSSIYYNKDAPNPYYWRAIVNAEQNPGHYSLEHGWSDICCAVNLTPDGKHPAHELLPIWKNRLFNAGFFPYLHYADLWKDFSRKYKVLYHVVPERYDSFFRKGILAFRSLSNLRSNEDSQEGLSEYESQMGGHHIKATNETESFVLCFSKQPEIKDVRGGVLYRVNTEKFIRALMQAFYRGLLLGTDIKYFTTGEYYPEKIKYILSSAGQVTYGKQLYKVPSPFVKGERFPSEQEVRISFRILSGKGRYAGGKSYYYSILTTDNPITIQINPDGCFHRMG